MLKLNRNGNWDEFGTVETLQAHILLLSVVSLSVPASQAGFGWRVSAESSSCKTLELKFEMDWNSYKTVERKVAYGFKWFRNFAESCN